jgi:tocopherol O-methyltransferase
MGDDSGWSTAIGGNPAGIGGRSARIGEIAGYYDEKTARLIDKYGPGPRVHYHTGISDGRFDEGAGTKVLSAAMFKAQELIMAEISGALGDSLPRGRSPRLLDVGCGLGGASIYLAQEAGAEVTGITIAAEHLKHARVFAERAGVAARVDFRQADAHRFEAEEPYDGAIALESSCYLDRRPWLERMAALLRPRAELHVFEWMRGSDERAAAFVDGYWKTSMGEPREYREAAAAAGFELVSESRLNERTCGFWALARAWNRAAALRPGTSAEEKLRLERSSEAISLLETAFGDGGLLQVYLVLRRP